MQNKYLSAFLRNIELWLSGAGLLVVYAASALLAPGGLDFWKVAALTALVVSVLHGSIFWIVRRRQRRLRRQAILEMREMLADVVKNQLAVIGMWLDMGKDDPEGFALQVEGIKDSIRQIEGLVDAVSEESIQSWKSKYAEAIESTGALQLA